MRERAAAIDATAADWAARVDRGPLSEAEQAELDAWAAADPRRAGAYARARAVSAHFDRARALGDDFVPARHPEARRRSRRRFLAGAGGLLAAGFAGAGVFALSRLNGRVATHKGDVRRVALSDGSAVTLNTDTAVRQAYGDKVRRVVLIRGEALFDVAKDAARPFDVVAGPVRVRAVGTSFTVRILPDDEVVVMVREGVVEVRRGDASPVRLAADRAVTVAASRPLAPVTLPAGGAERATAWRQGMLDLDGLTLAEAAGEYARYTDRRIRIADPAVAAMRVTGLFSMSDPDGFARAAALSLDLKVTSEPDGLRLDPRS
ncbi:FecR domain-containing protein [Phenylobacterium sp.]|uniref:FecR family protein n=1 Tax=Phenylobacterium sp. TaxID=1871053 RepID=UPI0025D6682C|nr:FecR domain-containing protein [Phenylobacterium sp.]